MAMEWMPVPRREHEIPHAEVIRLKDDVGRHAEVRVRSANLVLKLYWVEPTQLGDVMCSH
jgi:hypothetical protein